MDMNEVIAKSTLEPLIKDSKLKAVFVGGKGGVGKTSCSCAIAYQYAKERANSKVLLISTDPAHNISDALVQQFSGKPQKVNGVDNLYACEVDPTLALNEELENIGFSDKKTADDGEKKEETEMDRFFADFKSFFENLPGIDEAMALSSVLQYIETNEYNILIFDTSPSGHTIRLLQLPTVLKVGLEKLQSWKGRLASLLGSITAIFDSGAKKHQQMMEQIETKIQKYLKDVTMISNLFKDQLRTQFVCVCNASFLSVYETKRLLSELAVSGIKSEYVIVNMLMPRLLSTVTNHSNLVEELQKHLSSAGVDSTVSEAVIDAVELCGGISRTQHHYLKVLLDHPGIKLVFLPMLSAEIRGPKNIALFSKRLLEVDEKLRLDKNKVKKVEEFKFQEDVGEYAASTDAKFMTRTKKLEEERLKLPEIIHLDESKFHEGDRVEIHGLKSKPEWNGKQGEVKGEREAGRYEVKLDDDAKSISLKRENLKISKAPKSVPNGKTVNLQDVQITPEMVQLVQSMIMRPGGIKALLDHPLVKEMKQGNDAEMKRFFNDIEVQGMFAALGYLSNKHVINTLFNLAKEIQKQG